MVCRVPPLTPEDAAELAMAYEPGTELSWVDFPESDEHPEDQDYQTESSSSSSEDYEGLRCFPR